MHWTCTKISASAAIPDATLLEILLDKVSFFSSLCNTHQLFRRKRLNILLLNLS